MDGSRFDTLTRFLTQARGRSRRDGLRLLAGAALGGMRIGADRVDAERGGERG
jgi:hypothetical protein